MARESDPGLTRAEAKPGRWQAWSRGRTPRTRPGLSRPREAGRVLVAGAGIRRDRRGRRLRPPPASRRRSGPGVPAPARARAEADQEPDALRHPRRRHRAGGGAARRTGRRTDSGGATLRARSQLGAPPGPRGQRVLRLRRRKRRLRLVRGASLAVQHWVGSGGGAFPFEPVVPGAAVVAGAGEVVGSRGAAPGGGVTALKSRPSTSATSASTTFLSSTSRPVPPR